MAFTKKYDWDAMITDLFDLLAEHPEGKTITDICDRLEVDVPVARIAVNRLRETLGDDGNANIIVTPAGRDRLYRLVGAGMDDPDGAETEWMGFHAKYVASRLTTVRNVYMSLQRAATTEAQAEGYRSVLKQLDRLIEDVADCQQ